MKKYKIKIVGVTPYMQHKMNDVALEEWEKQRGRIIERQDIAQQDIARAEYVMYVDERNKPFIPSSQIKGSLIGAGTYIKSKVGNKAKSMKNIVAGMFFVNPEKIYLTEDWVVDKRSAVNRNIKARIICIRPRWDTWSAEFNLNIDNDSITDETVKNIIEYAGQYVGIGSFRPTNNGEYGRFKIAKFEKLK